MTDSLARAQKKYNIKCKQFSMRLRRDKDDDLIRWIDETDNATGKIKQMIRDQIKADIKM